jgi:hypothetical protein
LASYRQTGSAFTITIPTDMLLQLPFPQTDRLGFYD